MVVRKAAKGYACSDGRELLCLLMLYERGTNRCRQRGGAEGKAIAGGTDERGTDKRMLVEGRKTRN